MSSEIEKWMERCANERCARLEAEALLCDRLRTLYQMKAELEETQDELIRKERLATLGQLSSSVGHELRNPLGVMTNAVYYLQALLAGAPQEVSEYLGILKNQIHIAERIVSDLLDFARVKPPQRSVQDLPRLVEEQLARVAVPGSVQVERQFSDALPAAYVDPVQIGQVLLNLITNGLQAMEERGGMLTIRGEEVRDGCPRLSVEDTGPGVPADLRDKIFEPLFTTKARGIGLGLPVSRSLARAAGGALTLDDDWQGGARFVLELPVAGDPVGVVPW